MIYSQNRLIVISETSKALRIAAARKAKLTTPFANLNNMEDSMHKGDIYIEAIEYAIKRNDKFTFGELIEHLKLTDAQAQILATEIFKKNILSHNSADYVFANDAGSVTVWASALDRFRLIEYQELTEARDSAKSANKHAIWAIAISILLAVISIWQNYVENEASDKSDQEILRAVQNVLPAVDEIPKTLELIEARRIINGDSPN